MKKVLLSCLAAVSFSANALVVDFESGFDPIFNYEGVSVSNFSNASPGSGYSTVASFTGSDFLAFNPWEVTPSTFSWAGAGTFDLTSFVVAGAWGSQTLTIEGLLDGIVTFSSELAVTNTVAEVFSANWDGIDAFRVTTGDDFVQGASLNGRGQHWAIDNITINENVSVPAPAGALLLGLGLLALGAIRRKK